MEKLKLLKILKLIKKQWKFKEFRECHVKPDLLLIYKKENNILVFTCIAVGSHSDLFKK